LSLAAERSEYSSTHLTSFRRVEKIAQKPGTTSFIEGMPISIIEALRQKIKGLAR
jgi:hypothetical protein